VITLLCLPLQRCLGRGSVNTCQWQQIYTQMICWTRCFLSIPCFMKYTICGKRIIGGSSSQSCIGYKKGGPIALHPMWRWGRIAPP
jgi:hypothetical protein